jgi:chemotaxis protein methyltransferase CheR
VEAFNSFTPPVSILASDLDTSVLAQGEGRLSAGARRQAPARAGGALLPEGRTPRPAWLRVRPELQRLISFKRINLLDARWPVQGPLDAIFCRNVMIYFDKRRSTPS